MPTARGCLATSMKSWGVKVIPMESIRAPNAPVKYFVVNHANFSGAFKAMPANNTVHNGNNTVNVSVTFKYTSHKEVDFFVSVEIAASDIFKGCPRL